MKLKLMCTPTGLKPMYDEDYDNKKMLKVGTVYEATIKEMRNVAFHRKYFSLINLSWEYLDESQRAFFKEDVNAFRKTVEVAAGHYEPVYSVARQSWLEVPKSIAFDKLSESDFEQLYEKVKTIIFQMFIPQVNRDNFEYVLKDF